MYPAQDPYSSQQPAEGSPYPYPIQQPSGAMPYPAPGPYPPQGPYPASGPYPPQYPYMGPQPRMILSNPRAKRAMINGFISLAFSLLTLFTLAGFAGLITGTFAIIYGFMGLKIARQSPNQVGRGQAITGIVLGFVAWFLVLLSFFARSLIHS